MDSWARIQVAATRTARPVVALPCLPLSGPLNSVGLLMCARQVFYVALAKFQRQTTSFFPFLEIFV
jgi:hypothetical protein